jgi:phosphoglycerol transferase MdoB-like AlkP superfamily enzyme
VAELSLSRLRWIRALLFVGVLYLVAGLVFAALARSTGSNQGQAAWRLAAWVISAAAFAAHIAYEQVRLRTSPRTTALHASLAVGLGAFGLAVAASLHGQAVHRHFPVFALALWPVLTALPAFVVALAAAAVLSRARRKEGST